MTKRLIHSVLAAVALVGLGGCYQDDSSGPPRGRPLVRVSLTDAPFPYDSVTSVNIYVVRIEASTQLDTGCNRAPRPSWAKGSCLPASIRRSG